MPFFNCSGRRLHYLDQGEGEPLLLLHGLGSCALDWQPQLEHLKRNYRVIAPDLRGHGENEPVREPFGMSDMAEDSAALLQELNISRCTVLGFSLGGMVAFELALHLPKVVQALIIVNSGPQLVLDTWQLRFKFWLRLAIIRVFGMRTLAAILGRNLFPGKQQLPLLEQFKTQMEKMDRRSYCHTLGAIRNWSVVEQLDQLSVPVLIVTADQDYTPVSFKQAYALQLHDAELVVIENSRHATPLDQTERFNQVVSRFLNKLGFLPVAR